MPRMQIDAYHEALFQTQLEIQQQAFDQIASEVHSNIGQVLSLIRLNLSMIASINPEAGERKINECGELLDATLEDLRNLSKRLDVAVVKSLPLRSSLSTQINYIRKSGQHAVSFDATGEEPAIDPEHKLILFRMMQQLVNNAIKNPNTSDISLNITYLEENIQLSLAIDLQDLSDIFPIANIEDISNPAMFDRANMIGAKLSIARAAASRIFFQLNYPVCKNPSSNA